MSNLKRKKLRLEIQDFLENELSAESSSDGNWYVWNEDRTEGFLLAPQTETEILSVGLPFWDSKAPVGVHLEDSVWVLEADTKVIETDGGLWFFRELEFQDLSKQAFFDCAEHLRQEISRVQSVASRELEIRNNEILKVIVWLEGVYSEGSSHDELPNGENLKKLDEISLSMTQAILETVSHPQWRRDTMHHNRDEDFNLD